MVLDIQNYAFEKNVFKVKSKFDTGVPEGVKGLIYISYKT